MQIGIIGAGHIGFNCAVQLLAGGHDVMLSFTRDPGCLARGVRELGEGAFAGAPREAASFADVVILSVPWPTIDLALNLAGSLDSKIVIDTTNHFGPLGIVDLHGVTAARFNAERIVGGRYTKCFNTITAGYQRQAAGRSGDDRLVQWICGEDDEAKQVVGRLVCDAGYAPVDLGSIDTCAAMEAPRRPGAVYGEEYRPPDAPGVVAAVQANKPVPRIPQYLGSSGSLRTEIPSKGEDHDTGS